MEVRQGGKEYVLLLFGIPRTRNGIVERIDVQGFIVEAEIGALGEKL